MNINDLTVGQAKELAGMFHSTQQPAAQPHPYCIGANYLIRTVTMALTGRLLSVGQQELVLTDAAWIADTGRYANAVATGVFAEVEPYPDGMSVVVGRAAIIDAVEIPTLPRTQK